MDLAKAYSPSSKELPEFEQIGDLRVHGYSPMGKLAGSYGSVDVEAREMTIPARQVVSQSVRLELTDGGDYPQTGIAVISYDNIEAFQTALRNLQSSVIDRDRFHYSEIQFELDDIKITVFNNDRGSLMWALVTDNVSVHFPSLSVMSKLNDLIDNAKNHLKKIRE